MARRQHREGRELHKVFGVPARFSTVYGDVGSSSATPSASSSFARRAFADMVSFGLGWGQTLVCVATIAISALLVPHDLSVFWPVLLDWPYDAIGGSVTAVALLVITVIGLGEAARRRRGPRTHGRGRAAAHSLRRHRQPGAA